MGNVTFSGSGFTAQKATIASAFSSVNDKLTEINTESANLSLFWSSAEAETFKTKLEEVQTNMTNFITKYEAYMTFLDSVLSAYTADNSNLIDSINALISGGDGGTT